MSSVAKLFYIIILKVYKGYVDDLRNTDNAWIETVAMHFHDETREILGDIEFEVCLAHKPC